MSYANRLTMTVILVCISIIAIPLNFISPKRVGELYPFATWKLYTQPHGITDTVVIHALYVYKDSSYQKIKNLETNSGFNRDDKSNILRSISNEFTTHPSIAQKKFRALCHFLYPGYKSYQLTEEYYHPSEVKQNHRPYAIKVLITI